MARQPERGAELRLPRATLERVVTAERVVGDDGESRAPTGRDLERAGAIGESAGIEMYKREILPKLARPT